MTTSHATSFLRRWNRRVRRIATTLLILVLCALGLAPFGREALDELIRTHVQNELAQLYPELEVRLRGARRVPGEGFELRGFSLRDPQTDPRNGDLLSIETISLNCPTSFHQLWTGDLPIRKIHLRRPRVRVERQADASWAPHRLLPQIPESSQSSRILSGLRQVQIEEGELLFHDERLPSQLPLAARDIKLSLYPPTSTDSPSHPLAWNFRGHCSGDQFRRAGWEGTWTPTTQEFQVQGNVDEIHVLPELTDRLPLDIAEPLRPLAALRGRTNLSFSLQHRPDNLTYHIDGHFHDGWIRDPALPYSLTDLQADFRVGTEGVRVTDATARLGAAILHLELSRSGFEKQSPLRLEASTKNFPIDHRLPGMMPDSLRELWDKFLPSGTAHVDMVLTFDGEKYQPDVSIEFPDLSLTYHKFPYRVHNAQGALRVRQGILTADLTLPINGQAVHLLCEVHPTDSGPIGWAELETQGPIALDEALLSAFPEKTQPVLRSLQPTGLVEVSGRFERSDPRQAEFDRQLTIKLRQGAIRYEKFPLPIDRIEGSVSVQNDQWSFDRLTGRNDSAFIVARGNWDPEAQLGHHLALDLTCTDVPLHDGLRQSMNEQIQQFWNRLRPRGTIDHVNIGLRYQRDTRELDVVVDGEKWGPEQNVEGRSLSMKPVWFPFHLENMVGKFRYEKGRLKLDDLQAEHGMTKLNRATVHCSLPDRGQTNWKLEIPLLDIENLELNSELLAALPESASQALSRLGIRGPMSIEGDLSFSGESGSDLPPESRWNLVVDMENGELNCGVKLKHIRGGVTLEGTSGPEKSENVAELFIDSLTYQNTRFTQVRGPLRFENGYLLIGSTAKAEPNPAGLPRSLTARVFDGEATLDGWLGLADDSRFDIVTHLAGAELARMASDSSLTTARVTGKAFANLRLAGQLPSSHSWRGNGSIRLFEADIYQLPLMVALLKLLKIQPPDSTAFTQSDMEFRVEGDRMYIDRIALQGDAVSLIGNGEMDLQRNLKLDFGAVVGREDAQLPWFRPFALGAARSVLGIQVSGPLHQPAVTARPFPELNEALQQLFPEGGVESTFPWNNLLRKRETSPLTPRETP